MNGSLHRRNDRHSGYPHQNIARVAFFGAIWEQVQPRVDRVAFCAAIWTPEFSRFGLVAFVGVI